MTSTNSDLIKEEVKSYFPGEKEWIECIPAEYRRLSLWSLSELPEELRSYGLYWANKGGGRSMYLHGTFGSGKTSYAFCCIREIFRARKGSYFWPRYISARDFDASLLRASKADDGDEWEITRLATEDLLFVDDIDKISPSERFLKQFFEIINRRMCNQLPTIITSNCNLKELTTLVGGSLISRMHDKTKWQVVPFPDKDLRKVK